MDNVRNDECLKGFKGKLHGNWVYGGEYCNLFQDPISSSVHGKEYPQMWEFCKGIVGDYTTL
jgi:hypothetical protein